MIPRVLTVAGSDSGGGAGIQADLRTIALLGGFGMSAVTALTAQNSLGVKAIHEVPPDFVGRQMDAVISDIGVDAVKTGMLGSLETVRLVARKIRKYRISRLVVDPVMVAKGGARLLYPESLEGLKEDLIPLAQIVTPNIPEAEALTGRPVRGIKGMAEAARRIHDLGARNVLVKGGHLTGQAVDVFFDGRGVFELPGPRISTPHTHGTGCTVSAIIAVELARGSRPLEAVQKAKVLITAAIELSFPLGAGHGPVNLLAAASRQKDPEALARRVSPARPAAKRSRST